MATVETITGLVRLELGDLPENFRTSIRGSGDQDDFDLPGRNIIAASLRVYTLHVDNTFVDYTSPTNYTLDSANGAIHFLVPPEPDIQIIIEGQANGLFTDVELAKFVDAAAGQHLHNRTTTIRYRDGHGFIKYDRRPMELADLPVGEDVLVTLLATIESLWALATDASMDINVQTSEGTVIARGQRYGQIVQQIALLTDKYRDVSGMLGVGLYAPEVLAMRRVSKSTGRLVPVFIDREYDETGPPVRVVPPISQREGDPDGPPSPWYPSGYGP